MSSHTSGSLILFVLFVFVLALLVYFVRVMGSAFFMAVRAIRDGRRLHASVGRVGTRVFPVVTEDPGGDSREISAAVAMLYALPPLAITLPLAAWLAVKVVSLGGELAYGMKNPCLDLLPEAARTSLRITGKGDGTGSRNGCWVQYDDVRVEAGAPGESREQVTRELQKEGQIVKSVSLAGVGDDVLVAETPKRPYEDDREQLHVWRCGLHVRMLSRGHGSSAAPGVQELASATAPRLETLCVYGGR